MKIIVMCGAGASSTFVAQRLRGAIAERGLAHSAAAVSLASLPGCLDAADVLLLGPHLSDRRPQLERDAAAHGVRVAVLPGDIFGDRDGRRALALADEVAHAPISPADAAPTDIPPISIPPINIPPERADERNQR
ncbi:PTS sugar transporter subunit IIB [Microbacterium elymi]|uniref:PTS sugar transporter n=1 Tax=Microbacterium elymi TaxID=2909587 RepID=A0ABY3SST7_9MICO|nr:PTS sugar transporter [Microbacterium elymi]UJP11832.2 PTS sugar transporter [Microbacterium elymi]